MNQTEICRRLHDMVDQIQAMPPDLFKIGLPVIRVTYRSAPDAQDSFVLVVGLEPAGGDDE